MLTAEINALDQKTRELCQAVLDTPGFQTLRENINAFLSDESTRGQYDVLSIKGQALQQKQQMGMPLSEEEVEDFNRLRDALMSNPVAKNFLDAQQQMSQIHDSVGRYLSKTFELGRVPEPEDLSDGSCCNDSGGCGCH